MPSFVAFTYPNYWHEGRGEHIEGHAQPDVGGELLGHWHTALAGRLKEVMLEKEAAMLRFFFNPVGLLPRVGRYRPEVNQNKNKVRSTMGTLHDKEYGLQKTKVRKRFLGQYVLLNFTFRCEYTVTAHSYRARSFWPLSHYPNTYALFVVCHPGNCPHIE